ncbi:hypothetical protein [Kitasatospora sp. MAP5-34]|uniref:hypothetical protein n=1 Tax=Kitasatospora sp. MAP5-34 TaxID=3035102 RepID=UPI002475890D|nr:hypothetical protein [Kitasatospora sp. MAP5-34]MDH6577570.1 phage-related protein [Kitasatospora sp. MAP5-34]
MIEAARCPDGMLADQWIAKLERSKSRRDLDRLADIAIVFESFARRGTLEVPRELNELGDGLREIKVGKHRFPFFHLEGSPAGAVRLTHGFLKGTWPTPRGELDKAKWVRRKDLES